MKMIAVNPGHESKIFQYFYDLTPDMALAGIKFHFRLTGRRYKCVDFLGPAMFRFFTRFTIPT